MPKMANGLPERWLDYSNMGRRVAGTRFICFKVPLDKKYSVHGADFSVRDLTDYCEGLGLVIDLTNTNKYYNPQDLRDVNVEYKKIYTEGHVVPSSSVVRQFVDAVNDFLEANPDNDRLVGVHCTHGVNRTGYLVCRYMIQVMDMAPDQAIADFESARGHAQERDNYKEDLRKALWINEDPSSYKVVESRAARGRGGWHNGRWYHKLSSEAATQASSSQVQGGSRTPERPSRSARRGSYGQEDSDATPSSVNGSARAIRGRSSSRVRDGPEAWRVIPTDAAGQLEDSTPRGRKRHLERSESVSSGRGPWLPPCADPTMEPPRLRFKRAPCDARYGGTSQQRYDPYFYQQRQGGGPTRPERGPYVPSSSPQDGRRVKQYKGPRKYHNHQDDPHTSLGLENREPLSFPDDLPPRRGFLGSGSAWEDGGRGPGRDPRSPGVAADVFSPDNTPRGSARRKRPARYEPY